jgi:hypothetical protein
VPAGYPTYRDPTGFSIAMPDGWHVAHQGHYVYLTPPTGTGFLLIDQSGHPQSSPLADWPQQEASRKATYPGYHRLRLVAIRYPQAEKAADWEFTYDRNGVLTHVLNRNVLANAQHAYALYWSAPESQWASGHPVFEVLARTFQPARDPAGRSAHDGVIHLVAGPAQQLRRLAQPVNGDHHDVAVEAGRDPDRHVAGGERRHDRS